MSRYSDPDAIKLEIADIVGTHGPEVDVLAEFARRRRRGGA